MKLQIIIFALSFNACASGHVLTQPTIDADSPALTSNDDVQPALQKLSVKSTDAAVKPATDAAVKPATDAAVKPATDATVKPATDAAVKPVYPNFPTAEYELENPANIPKCTVEELSTVEGYLLDLDGTIYSSAGLLPGAVDFFDWLNCTEKSHVLLSNGFKGKAAVSKKLSMAPFKLNQAIPTTRVHTAAISLAKYLEDNVPPNSNLYVIGSVTTYQDGSKEFPTRIIKQEVSADLFDSWNIRTDMTIEEIYDWADKSRNQNVPTYVILAGSGKPSQIDDKSKYVTMDFTLITKITTLLRNNAFFVVSSPDIVHPRPKNAAYPGIDTSWVTTGAYEQLFLAAAEMYGTERRKKMHANVGKGGNMSPKYMMEPAFASLEEQSPGISKSNIVIIGDNFGTDIMAGNLAGIRSILVLAGAHGLKDALDWKSRPTCYLHNIGEIVNILPCKA